MINALSPAIQLALLRVLKSGWTIVVMVAASLILSSLIGRQAFVVWSLSASSMLLIGISVSLGNLPYRLLKPSRVVSRWSEIWSWIIWGLGALLLMIAPTFAKTPLVIILGPAGVLTGVLFCKWVSHREPLKWTR